jgi:outer membrane receptor protein involved in Fe transport
MSLRSMGRINAILLSGASFAVVAATPAYAQQPPADQAPPEALQTEQAVESGQPDCNVPAGTPLPPGCTPPVTEGAITVTGSRIRRPNLDSPLPVTSVGGEEFFQTGNISVGDKLAEVPSIRSSFTQANSTRFLGTAGVNLLDLRGLGIKETLVLVNGRRHVGGDVLLTGVAVDVNTIPADLIERVDIVTGGNSAVYGSDAVAGVVNFVLKRDYDGILLRGQGGQSKYGDADAYFISALVGKNFAEGRGNVAVNFEYARRDQAWGAERSWFRQNYAIGDSDPANATDDGNPDLIRNPDFRSATFNNTGNIRFGGPGTTLNCGLDPQGNPYTCPFIFMPNGQLVPQTGTRIGLGPNGQFVGGNGEGFFSGHQIQITPQLDRYNVNALAHFEVSPAFVPFVEAKYSRTDSVGTGASGPAFMGGGGPFAPGALGDFFEFFGGYNRELISINNPFLSDQARQTIIQQSTLAGFPPNDATRFLVQQAFLGLGNRTEEARRETFRIVGGARGDLGNNWNYEVSLNYGRLKEKTKILNNLDTQRMLLAMDAVRDPATGNIVCRSQIDPSAAFGGTTYFYYYYYGPNDPRGDPNAPARLAADVAACVPVNPLGGNFTQAQKDYLLLETTARGETKQLDALAFISGDTSNFFELPGGPIGIVLGVEYRTDNLFYQQDPQVELGYTFYNPIPTFEAPKSKVKEAFGEIRLPLFKDTPFLQQLEISGAARVSDYNLGTTGTVWAYNGNVIWSPVRGLRFRGNYARAVRAPNQVELFTPFGQNFALVIDPCDVNAVGLGSENRAANCIAAGIPAGTAINYASSLPFQSGGNENLEAEKSDSITIGGVVTPAFLPGFSASVDYYDIKVKNVIIPVGAQTILNSCYDLPSLDNPFCGLFRRAGPGQLGHSGQPFGVIANSLLSSPVNFAELKTRGIDVEVAYRRQLGSIGRLDTRLTWTHVLELTQFIDPTNPAFGDRILSEVGDPQDRFNWNTSLKHGRFTFGYQMRYVGKQITFDEQRVLGEYEDFFGFEGRPPQNPDLFAKKWIKSRLYHDVRFAVDVGPKYNFYLGVDNLLNKKPAFALSGTGAGADAGGGSAIFDAVGRFYYAGFSAKF